MRCWTRETATSRGSSVTRTRAVARAPRRRALVPPRSPCTVDNVPCYRRRPRGAGGERSCVAVSCMYRTAFQLIKKANSDFFAFNDVSTNAVRKSCRRGAQRRSTDAAHTSPLRWCAFLPGVRRGAALILRSSLIARCLGHDAALDLRNVRTVDPLQLLTILQRQGVPGTISANVQGEAAGAAQANLGGAPGER